MKKALVTGGSCFISSHLIDAFITNGNNISVFDNLSGGTLQNIKQWLGNPKFTSIKSDLLKPTDLKKLEEKQHKRDLLQGHRFRQNKVNKKVLE